MTSINIYTVLQYLYIIPLIFSAVMGVFYVVLMGDYILKRHGIIIILLILILPFIPIINIIWLKSLVFNEG